VVKRAHIDKVGSIQRLRILEFIKQHDGVTVAEIAKKFRLSYMGAQGHVRLLEKDGFLHVSLRREQVGRPQRLFRPSEKGHALFEPEPLVQLRRALDAVAALYGVHAPEKVLYTYFQNLAKEYGKKVVAPDVGGRLAQFAKIRDHEGTMPRIEKGQADRGHSLVEYQPPLAALEPLYPAIGRFEQEMVENLMRCAVRRWVAEEAGSCAVTFEIIE